MDWTVLNNNNFQHQGQTKHNLIPLAFLSSIYVPLFYVQCILGAFKCLPPLSLCECFTEETFSFIQQLPSTSCCQRFLFFSQRTTEASQNTADNNEIRSGSSVKIATKFPFQLKQVCLIRVTDSFGAGSAVLNLSFLWTFAGPHRSGSQSQNTGVNNCISVRLVT